LKQESPCFSRGECQDYHCHLYVYKNHNSNYRNGKSEIFCFSREKDITKHILGGCKCFGFFNATIYACVFSGDGSGNKKIEESVTEGYTKLEDKFVEAYLTKDGETVEEAKARLKKENQ